MTEPAITESPLTRVPDFWVDDETDDDGVFIPGHMVDMSNFRRRTWETQCPNCGQIHGRTAEMHVQVAASPPLYTRLREMTRTLLVDEVAACTQKEADHGV